MRDLWQSLGIALVGLGAATALVLAAMWLAGTDDRARESKRLECLSEVQRDYDAREASEWSTEKIEEYLDFRRQYCNDMYRGKW